MDYEKKYKEMKARVLEMGRGYVKGLDYSKPRQIAEYIDPELKESEDERIRKRIIQALHGDVLDMEETTKAIAWLNKQGEQKDIPADAVLDGNKDGLIADTIRCKREKQVEQKPAEWSEDNLPEFESYLCLMFQKFRTKGICTNGEIIDFVNEHSQKLKDILCRAWSEEDEKIYQSIMDDTVQENQLNSNQTNWLRDIKYRYFPQPKQEWSEEDEYCRHQLIVFCENCMVQDAGAKRCAHWLKSLRPQNTWKPCDEQMDALNYIVNLMASSERPTENDLYYNILKSLRQQLKKLREE